MSLNDFYSTMVEILRIFLCNKCAAFDTWEVYSGRFLLRKPCLPNSSVRTILSFCHLRSFVSNGEWNGLTVSIYTSVKRQTLNTPALLLLLLGNPSTYRRHRFSLVYLRYHLKRGWRAWINLKGNIPSFFPSRASLHFELNIRTYCLGLYLRSVACHQVPACGKYMSPLAF